mmetsp:Transcript_12956/g.36332  ORF Transcript_12956/g.36332 Transcript_12956/m.36332 type:complete len:234 (+) Transcript_12956:272-973(+)
MLVRQAPIRYLFSAPQLRAGEGKLFGEFLAIHDEEEFDSRAKLRALILVAPMACNQSPDVRRHEIHGTREMEGAPLVVVLVELFCSKKGRQGLLQRRLPVPALSALFGPDPQRQLWSPGVRAAGGPRYRLHRHSALPGTERPLQVRDVGEPPAPPTTKGSHPSSNLRAAVLRFGYLGPRRVVLAPDERRTGLARSRAAHKRLNNVIPLGAFPIPRACAPERQVKTKLVALQKV